LLQSQMLTIIIIIAKAIIIVFIGKCPKTCRSSHGA
jgi:hypothetical protein